MRVCFIPVPPIKFKKMYGFHLLFFFSLLIVTVPPGLYPGDPMTVATPDGQYISVTVPEGMCGGSTFLVEFVSGPPPMSSDKINEQSPKMGDDDLPVAVPVPTY